MKEVKTFTAQMNLCRRKVTPSSAKCCATSDIWRFSHAIRRNQKQKQMIIDHGQSNKVRLNVSQSASSASSHLASAQRDKNKQLHFCLYFWIVVWSRIRHSTRFDKWKWNRTTRLCVAFMSKWLIVFRANCKRTSQIDIEITGAVKFAISMYHVHRL